MTDQQVKWLSNSKRQSVDRFEMMVNAVYAARS